MLRLFVGLGLPATIKERILQSMGGVEGARWQTADQLHLTLRFIGDVDERQAEEIAGRLQTITFPPFAMHLSDVGFFGKPKAPRVIWTGARPADRLKALHEKVDAALNAIGLAPEERKFVPHVTLARLRRPKANQVLEFVARNGDFMTSSFEIEGFNLYRSQLSHEGAHYEVIATFPF